MEKTSIPKILNAIIIFSAVLGAAFLVSLFVPKAYGIAIGIVFIAITIFGFFTENHFNIPQKFRDVGLTLLLNIVLFIGAMVSAFVMGGKFVPIYLCCSFIGFVGIIKWIVEKKWTGKSIAAIIKDDFHLLPPIVDIAIITLNILDIIFGKGDLSVSTMVINSVLLLDILIQIIPSHGIRKLDKSC